MCEFEYELEQVIEAFIYKERPFTSLMVCDGIRDGFNMPITCEEADRETLAYMRRNVECKYVARAIEVVTGQDVLGQDECASAWEFTPIKTIVDDFSAAKPGFGAGEVVVAKRDGGFFARIFAKE